MEQSSAASAAAAAPPSYAHYHHADSCSSSRWTAKESYEFMSRRRWRSVSDFYSDVVRSGGYPLLSSLFPTEGLDSRNCVQRIESCSDVKSEHCDNKTGRWARVTFKIILSYHGTSFDGWQKQPGLNTIQGLVERSLGIFVDENKAQHLKDQSLPLEGCAVVAGRTDKGVTALKQVCSFYTWRKDVRSADIEHAINNLAPGKIKAMHVSEVSRVFHPNFSAKWRQYLYIMPLCNEGGDQANCIEMDAYIQTNNTGNIHKEVDGVTVSKSTFCDIHSFTRTHKIFDPSKVDQILRRLEGKCLSYKMFARDTKASRSEGPPTECFMFHARAAETKLPCTVKGCVGESVMCVELVANRFLRRMVRVLVATAVREAVAGAGDDALLNLMDATCRRATATPAPPDGLCLVNVGYGDFEREHCLIL